MRSRQVSGITAVVACALLLGCGDRRDGSESELASATDIEPIEQTTPEPVDSVPAPEDAGPTPAEWTAEITDARHTVTAAAVLTSAEASTNEGFDRLVLEFDDVEMPSYRIEYVDNPLTQCGSGEPVEVEGDGRLAIRLEPANAHTWEGQPTIEERSWRPDLQVMRQITLTCDFEAQVEWVVGVAAPNRYRVMELADPARLVVDIRH